MADKFNIVEEQQFSISGAQKRQMSNRERLMMEALLEDSGFFIATPAPSAVGAPTPTPAPKPTPTPAPTATPAPTPAPAAAMVAAPSAPTTINAVVRLAMTTVKPGDLITADFANNLVEALIALDRRVTSLEDGVGRAALAATPTPSPSPTPTPRPSKSAPVIDSVDKFTVKGRGVAVTVTGNNIGEGLVEDVLLGKTSIDLSKVKFEKGGFNFLTTTAAINAANNRLTVVTSGGQDIAPLTPTIGKAPVQ
jgi:biotin carboxyl carrier protein